MSPITLVAVLLHTVAIAQSTVVNVPQDALQRAVTGYSEGKGTFYSKNLMQKVAIKRGFSGEGSYATYPDCEEIGGVIWVSVWNPIKEVWSGWESKRIVDCSQYVDRPRHIAEGLVELSYEDALKYGYIREGHTKIRFHLEGDK